MNFYHTHGGNVSKPQGCLLSIASAEYSKYDEPQSGISMAEEKQGKDAYVLLFGASIWPTLDQGSNAHCDVKVCTK